VLKNALDTSQSLDDVGSVVVQVPELAVVPLMRPPERVVFDQVVGLEVLTHTPALIVGEGETVLLEECVDSRNAVVPRFFQVVQGQTPILGLGLLAFERVLGPNPLRVYELALPRLNVP